MNKEIIDEVNNLVEIIKKHSSFKRYQSIKVKMLENKELMDLLDSYRKIQQKLVKAEYYNKTEEMKSLKKELLSYDKTLLNIPIYQEYLILLEELNNIFGYIKENLENYFYNKINEEF